MADIVSESMIEEKLKEIKEDAQNSGYYLNTDEKFVKELVSGILTNRMRYGFESCPCRLTIGKKENNLDIICPCDYRDDDITEYGYCYCALYVSEDVIKNNKTPKPIPDRRGMKKEKSLSETFEDKNIKGMKCLGLKYPIFRCKVCGYLCARNTPPEKCPICKADSERFEKYI